MGKFELPPNREIIPPEGGWEEQTTYLVEVSFRSANPIHRALFFSGFLIKGKPGGYNRIFNPTYENYCEIYEVYYLKVIKVVATKEDLI